MSPLRCGATAYEYIPTVKIFSADAWQIRLQKVPNGSALFGLQGWNVDYTVMYIFHPLKIIKRRCY